MLCSVFDAVMSSEAEFGSVHEIDGKRSRATEQSSILSFLAATWDYYGGKYESFVYVHFTYTEPVYIHVHDSSGLA